MHAGLHLIALTGGIATGKSTCLRILKELMPELIIFDADEATRNLYKKPEIVASLKAHFGKTSVDSSGKLKKSYLRQRVFSNKEDKAFIEELFHPIIREECLAQIKNVSRNSSRRQLFIADIPLLFETQFDIGQSCNLLVACRSKTQAKRLEKRNSWQQEEIQSALAAQLPIEAKLPLADVVFWNEGPLNVLRAQCQRFIRSLAL